LPDNREPKFFYGYVVVLAAFFIVLLMFGTLYTFGVFFKPVSTEFDWTSAATSGAFALYMILHGALYIVTGRLNDRFGPRMVMTACGLFLGLGYLLMSQISAIWQLYLFYGVIIGIGMSGGFVPLVSTVSRWFVKRRGLMTGIVLAGIGMGTVIMPPVASWLISTYGWRTSYMMIGIIALVFIVLAAQFLRRDPGQMGQLPYGENGLPEKGLDLQARGFSVQEAIHTRQFWIVCATGFCSLFCIQAVMVHIVPHATELGISATIAANILAVIGGLSIAGRIIIGSVGDRIGNKPAVIFSLILLSVALLWLQLAKEVWMLYLFAAIFGFAYGGWVALISPIVAELFGLSSHGITLGIIAFGFTIGGAIGPVLAGSIFDITSSYYLAFLVCATMSVIGVILALLLTQLVGKEEKNDSKRSP